MFGKVTRAGASDLLHDPQPPQPCRCQQALLHEPRNPRSFTHQVDKTFAFAEMDGKCRVLCQEGGQCRQQHGPCEAACDIHPQQPSHRPAGTSVGILEIREGTVKPSGFFRPRLV